MTNSLYKLYRDSVFSLAMTTIVKHSEIATLINNALINGWYNNTIYSVGTTPSDWKYYKNLAGEYHQADMDALLEKNGLTVTWMAVNLFADENIPLAGNLSNLIDGTRINDGDRVFLANQTTSTENGFFNAVVDSVSNTYRLDQQTIGGVVKNNTAFLVYNGETYGNTVVTFTTPVSGQTPFGTTGNYMTKQPNGILVPVAVRGGTYVLKTLRSELLYGPNGDIVLANNYAFGTDRYNTLIAQYPEFEELILGILYPVDKEIAIGAKDGDILYSGGYRRVLVNRYDHDNNGNILLDGSGQPVILETIPQFTKSLQFGQNDPNLIEDNEDNLLPEMERWLKVTMKRWHNPGYNAVDNLYQASMMGILYMQLVPQILNIRLKNCLTVRAHSYHVAAYLDSIGGIGKYIQYIPKSMTMWLYRNARRLRNNTGKQGTFQELVDNLLTPAGIPLSAYSLRHNLTDLLINIADVSPDLKKFYPTAEAERMAVNFDQVGGIGKRFTVTDLIKKEMNLAPDNSREYTDIISEIETAIVTGQSNNLPTKLLESNMVDMSDHVPYPLPDVLINYWLYCASNGTYTAELYVTHPVSKETLLLNPVSAAILMFYCLNMAYTEQELKHIPTILAHSIPRNPNVAPSGLNVKPTLSGIKQWVDNNYLSDTVVENILDLPYDASNSVVDTDYTYANQQEFYNGAVKVQKQLNDRWLLVCGVEDAIGRGMADFVANSCYWSSVSCEFVGAPTLYADWLNEAGISFEGMTSDQFLELGLAIVKQTTGNLSESNTYLANLQKALMAIMKAFSSYSVQYIYSLSSSPERLLDMKRLRITNHTHEIIRQTKLELGAIAPITSTKTTTSPTFSIPWGASISWSA